MQNKDDLATYIYLWRNFRRVVHVSAKNSHNKMRTLHRLIENEFGFYELLASVYLSPNILLLLYRHPLSKFRRP